MEPRLSDVSWHLIGLFESWVQAGIARMELRGEQLWVVPTKEAALAACGVTVSK